MRIGVDIDGTLNNLDEVVRPLLEKQYNIKPDFTVYEMFPNMTREQKDEFHRKNRLILLNEVKPFINANDVIHKLSKDGHTIFIITARKAEKCFDDTIQWFIINDFNLDDFDYFCFDCYNKVKTCLDNKIDIMIEDCPMHLDNLYQNTTTIKMNHLYNENINSDYEASSWNEIYEIIEKVKTLGQTRT